MSTVFQNILQNERKDFLSKNYLDSYELKTFNFMAACKTKTFGFNSYECEECGYKTIHYNSCGNRHCPSCQAKMREDWISKFQSFLLDIPYFHVVFTLPDSLNDIILNNKETMLNLLFKTSSKTLLKVCSKEYGQIGFSSILHTWGQNLWFHPHIHMIVSGGGLTADDNENEIFKKAPMNYLAPVKVLSKVFRGKFIAGMRKLSLFDKDNNKIDLDSEPYLSLVKELYSKEWVVYTKKPFGSNQAVLNYIGRYSHRVAISNSRIKDYNSNMHTVTFAYKDYKDHSKKKEMTLDAVEFIRRFMLHILPSRFIKIRHYGFMSNSNRKTKIPLCRKLLNQPVSIIDPADKSDHESQFQCQCPKCHGKLIIIGRVRPPKSITNPDSP